MDRYRKGYIKLQGGRMIKQFNPDNPILPIFNSLSTLIWRYNYMKIYQTDLAAVSFGKALNDKLSLKVKVGWEERSELFNQTNYSWAKTDLREYTPNAPISIEDSNTSFPVHQAFTTGFKLVFHPILKYRKVNGIKEPIQYSFPVLSLEYHGGFKNILGSDVGFNRIEASFQHQLGEYRLKFDFRLFGGNTFSNNNLYFMDYSHFNGNQIPIDYTDPMKTYQLLDYYKYSTSGTYLGLHTHLSMKKFVLTQIGWLNLIGIREGISFNYLKTEFSPHYYELGYAVENIGRFFKLGVFTNFENDQYIGYGVRIGLSLGGVISFGSDGD
jgi:hypothetical protein